MDGSAKKRLWLNSNQTLLRQMVKWRPFDWAFYKLLCRWKWANRHLGHMMLFVCRKNLDF